MINDMKSLLAKLNPSTTRILHNAAGLCVSRTNYEIAVEHFLVKAAEDSSGDIQAVLRRFEIDSSRLLSTLTDSLEDFNGVTGRLSFDSNGDVKKGGVYLFQVMDGKYEKIN